VNIIDCMEDGALFAKTFLRSLRGGDTWVNWKVFLRVLFGLSLDKEAKEIFARHTGRTDAPAQGFTEAFAVVGRRGGKSVIAALVATFLAAFKNYDDVLAPGETGTLMVIAGDRRQARVIFNYIAAFFQLPMLRSMVVSQLKESISLTNRVVIEIHTCSFKATRGYTLIGVIADELAFWNSDDSANPDVEVLNALRPGLATTNGLLLGVSSPYAKRGTLFHAYREHFGKPSEVLVWKASSREMNPSLNMTAVATAYARDAASARAEFGGEFRDDVEGLLPLEVVEVCVRVGRRELPFISGENYFAFTDPSGGRSDAMTLAVAHCEREIAVLDLLREVQPPFSPERTVREFADTLKRYRIYDVEGDRYAGEWPREQFAKQGISYRVAEKTKSEFFLELLPLLTSGRCELLDNPRLITQLVGLERRTARGGRDSVDHSPGAHDDIANSAAGALVRAIGTSGNYGFLEFVASGGFERVEKIVAAQLRPVKQPESATEERACQCGGTVWQEVSGQLRCQQCGNQIWPHGAPELAHFSRKNVHTAGRRIANIDQDFLRRWGRFRS
jgi:hypothetical protein